MSVFWCCTPNTCLGICLSEIKTSGSVIFWERTTSMTFGQIFYSKNRCQEYETKIRIKSVNRWERAFESIVLFSIRPCGGWSESPTTLCELFGKRFFTKFTKNGCKIFMSSKFRPFFETRVERLTFSWNIGKLSAKSPSQSRVCSFLHVCSTSKLWRNTFLWIVNFLN